jgi:hypothetical protein
LILNLQLRKLINQFQVLALMPLRTTMNYQYRYGGSTKNSILKLYNDGGFKRYYHGLLPALIQGPIARFGDTFANVGILALLASNPLLNKLPSPLKTVFASVAGALFRMILVPIDTVKVLDDKKLAFVTYTN